MTIIYFVRHGQTDWNKLGVYRGRADRPLNEIGARQAELVRDSLKNQGIAKLYASPMRRTIGTLSKFSTWLKHKPIAAVKGLIDIDYGRWQGVKKEEAEKEWSELARQWREDPFSVTFPGGESLKEVQDRALKAVQDICKDAQDATVAVCSHRVVLKALFCAFVGSTSPRAFYTFKLDPASISIVRMIDGHPVIETFNGTHHLRGDNPLDGPEDF
jgi:broad specificity phosphatase PhoE